MTERNPKIVVIGGTYIDLAVKCCHIPAPGQSLSGSSLSCTLAGPGPIQAVQAALCRCDVSLISKVGGDAFAQMVLKGLAEYKVDTEYVFFAEAKNTGVIVTLVNCEGENAICHYTGANSGSPAGGYPTGGRSHRESRHLPDPRLSAPGGDRRRPSVRSPRDA